MKGGGCGLHSHNSWIYPQWPRPSKRERHRQKHMYTPEPEIVSLGDKSYNKYEQMKHLMQGVSFQGYDVIVYLNGEGRHGSDAGEDESVCNTREPASGSAKTVDCPLVGGETVFYSERYGGNIPMATVSTITYNCKLPWPPTLSMNHTSYQKVFFSCKLKLLSDRSASPTSELSTYATCLFVRELVVLHTTPFMFGKFSVHTWRFEQKTFSIGSLSVKLIMALQKVLKMRLAYNEPK